MAFLDALQGDCEKSKAGVTVEWEWDGKSESREFLKTPDQLMADVMAYLEHIKPGKYGRSTDRTRFRRQA